MNQSNDPYLDKIRSKFFKESFMGIAIFGIPAFSALFLGRYLEKILQTSKIFTLILLLIAFISSWTLIYFRNKKIVKEYREYREIQKAQIVLKNKEENTRAYEN